MPNFRDTGIVLTIDGACPCCGARLKALHYQWGGMFFIFMHQDEGTKVVEEMRLCKINRITGEHIRRNYELEGESVAIDIKGAETHDTVQRYPTGSWLIMVCSKEVDGKISHYISCISQFKSRANQRTFEPSMDMIKKYPLWPSYVPQYVFFKTLEVLRSHPELFPQ